MSSGGRSPRWLYILPALHLCLALFALIGIEIQQVPLYPSHAWDFLFVVDFPISLGLAIVGWGSGWGYTALTWIWMLVVCSCWWYLLSLLVYKLISGIRNLFQRPSSDGFD